MNKFLKVADLGCAVVLLMGGTTSFIVLIATIGLCRSCMGLDEIDIDNSYMVKRYQFDRRFVEDSTGNGYELLWYTTNYVTEKRYKEILTRQSIQDSYRRLEAQAGDHFNHRLIETDIYEFVDYAKSFDIDPAVRLTNIWVYGSEYQKLYYEPHPDYPDGWRLYNDPEFGILYLTEYDIYPYRFDIPRKYRYWNCGTTSHSNEMHTHIQASDRKNK